MGSPGGGRRTESPEDVIAVEGSAWNRTAFLILAGPDDPCTPRWKSSVEETLSADAEVHLYLIDRGVLHLRGMDLFRSNREKLRVYACAYGARRYDVPFEEPVVFAGLTVLSGLIMGCPVFICAAPTHGAEEFDWPRAESFAGKRVRDRAIEDIVVYVRWNPRESHLPVEGLRIASGLTVAGPRIRICLGREASPLLDLTADEIVDGDRRDDYIDILGRSGAVFYHEGKCAGGGNRLVESRQLSGKEARGIVSTAGRLIVV